VNVLDEYADLYLKL